MLGYIQLFENLQLIRVKSELFFLKQKNWKKINKVSAVPYISLLLIFMNKINALCCCFKCQDDQKINIHLLSVSKLAIKLKTIGRCMYIEFKSCHRVGLLCARSVKKCHRVVLLRARCVRSGHRVCLLCASSVKSCPRVGLHAQTLSRVVTEYACSEPSSVKDSPE